MATFHEDSVNPFDLHLTSDSESEIPTDGKDEW